MYVFTLFLFQTKENRRPSKSIDEDSDVGFGLHSFQVDRKQGPREIGRIKDWKVFQNPYKSYHIHHES